MKHLTTLLFLAFTSLTHAAPVPLSDGKTFEGWDGDTEKTWKIVDGAFVGGSLTEKVPRNEFLCTKKEYANFVLKLKVKLEGTEGFVNGGIQIRSQRIPNHNEVKGYQADLGLPNYWGAIYDESRRNQMIATVDEAFVKKNVKQGDWNDYVIRCEGKRIQIFINGAQSVEYTEGDESIPLKGIIGVQVHGDGKAVASYKDITIEELP